MTNSEYKVLSKLREKGSQGVTWDDFPRGFALRSRISDMRPRMEIRTLNEHLDSGCIRARYFLISEGKKAA